MPFSSIDLSNAGLTGLTSHLSGTLSPSSSPTGSGKMDVVLEGDTSKSLANFHWETCVLNPHPRYFFEDGNLLIRVDGVDFKVHRYFFMRDSEKFRQISIGGTSGRISGHHGNDKGTVSDSSPLLMEGLTATALDFERFLSILYPTRFDKPDDNSVEHWASVLEISKYLAFWSIFLRAVDALSSIATSIDRIIFGRKFGIKTWLLDAYFDTCTREAPLTEEEGRRLGVDDVVRIMMVQHTIRNKEKQISRDERLVLVGSTFKLKIGDLGSKTVERDDRVDITSAQALWPERMEEKTRF